MTEKNRTYSAEDMNAIRSRLAEKSGPEYWRSLEELAQDDTFQEYIRNEFPGQAATHADALSRRNFLQVMGATLALAGVTSGCARQPTEKIYPYAKAPEEIVPGKPLYFASAFPAGGYAKAVLVETHMGRPTKVEGLPGHPSCDGASDVHMQVSILDLYDPDRSQQVLHFGNLSSWDTCVGELKVALDTLRPQGGEGVRILTGTVTSPSLAGKIGDFIQRYPNAKWHQYEPVNRDNAREGARQAFGEYVDAHYHFENAERVVSLDADFFSEGPANVRHMLDYAQRRGEIEEAEHAAHHEDGEEHGHSVETPELNRVYAVESTPGLVGASADNRIAVPPSHVEPIARVLAQECGVRNVPSATGVVEDYTNWIQGVAADLKQHRGSSIVIAGDHQPPVVHALAFAINDVLGNLGQTITFSDPVEANPVNQAESLRELVDDMRAGDVELLFIFGTNPVYATPADIDFLGALQNVGTRVHLGRHLDETAEHCQWHVPDLHYLESWGDARAFDGTVSIIQPATERFYNGKSPLEFLSALLDVEAKSAQMVVQDYWRGRLPGGDFDAAWRTALSEGAVPNTAVRTRTVRMRSTSFPAYAAPQGAGSGELEISFRPDPNVGDGTYCNNAWLQELAKPLTKLTWDNAIILSPATAKRLNLAKEDRAKVSIGDRSVEGAVWIQPGHPNNTATVHFGYGRRRCGRVGRGMGFNAYTIWTSGRTGFATGSAVESVGGKYPLACTEEHYAMENRELVRHYTQEEFNSSPDPHHLVQAGYDEHGHTPTRDESLFDAKWKDWPGNKWGMTIDLNRCTGCNACVVACQSENIIPVVGKTEVRKGREMQWIRVDRYYTTGSTWHAMYEEKPILEHPKTYFQPVPCMQCENAPCELVCPVGATQHSREGLNDMIYNRCIGTRYCSNNCPYKVRRFNFFNYSKTPLGSRGDRVNVAYDPVHLRPETVRPMRNPDVTVRTRGVMEKCTYCVQRINQQRIEDKKRGNDMYIEGRATGPLDRLTTACQQACPTRAITFGNLNDPESHVSRTVSSPRNYGILVELNTQPRTTYLARLTNPNEEIDGEIGS